MVDVAVVGIPSGSWGHEAIALVVPRPGAMITLQDLLHHARPTLAAHKLPRRLLIVPTLPRTASGKLLRHALLDRFRDKVSEEKAT